jgi:glycosyltransferase involved in cell wall biosynthesis
VTYSAPVSRVGTPLEPGRPPSGLRASLENDLPVTIPVGQATAVFCYGHCFHVTEEIASVQLVIAGRRHRPNATGMARRDLYEWLHRSDGEQADPLGHSYRSGFWATLVIPPQDRPRQLRLDAVVALRSGAVESASLGQIEVAEPVRSPPGGALPVPPVDPDAIAICLAAYEPDLRLFQMQLDSLRAQTDERWVCVVSDGGSTARRHERMLELIGDDRRFCVSRSQQRLDPYRNFERALRLAPPEAELIALCDQDDRWYPRKLEVLRGAIGSRALVYSDQRLVTGDGRVLRDSLWHGRRNDHENLASLLVANTVPGAAMLFRRELLSIALPFPDAPGAQYHDHWLALVALAAGEIGYVDEPLYDYVQHPAAVQGATRAGTTRPLLRRSRGWRGAYFGGYLNRQVWAQALLARCGRRLDRRKCRALTWFIAAERSALCFAWLALRPLRRVAGRDETLGGEAALAAGVAWRRMIVAAVGRAKAPRRRAYDASFPNPPEFEQRRLRRWRAVG